MITVDIESEPGGFERRSLECRKCGHAETAIVVGDPYRSDGVIGDLRVSE